MLQFECAKKIFSSFVEIAVQELELLLYFLSPQFLNYKMKGKLTCECFFLRRARHIPFPVLEITQMYKLINVLNVLSILQVVEQ